MHALRLRIAARSTFLTLLAGVALFALGHVVVMVLTLGLGYNELFGFARMFNLNEEHNLPTVYSALLLLGCAALLAVITTDARRTRSRDARYWSGLAAGFAFMALDEAVTIHELLNAPLRAMLGASGPLYFAWVVPYGLLAAAVGLLYARFLLRLPRAIAVRFVVAGLIFVGGAVGVELLQGLMYGSYGHDYRSAPMELAYLVEETMEMFGVAYFIHALLLQLQLQRRSLRLAIELSDSLQAAPARPVHARAALRRARP